MVSTGAIIRFCASAVYPKKLQQCYGILTPQKGKNETEKHEKHEKQEKQAAMTPMSTLPLRKFSDAPRPKTPVICPVQMPFTLGK